MSLSVNSERERLLCYAAGIMGSILANPGNIYSAEGLTARCIRAANQLIETIYDDGKLEEILKGGK
jgi:hypothetical protein